MPLKTRCSSGFSGLPDLKHVHYTGSADFSAGRLSPHEVQVYRTATFLCMGPHVDRITSASIPVFYIPSNLQESDPNHPEKLIKKYWALIGSPSHSPAAKIRRIPSVGPSSESIEISLLIAYLSEDVAVGRRPCVAVARATSSSVLGEWDDLGKIRDPGGAVDIGSGQRGGIRKVRSCVRVGMDKSAYDEEKLELLIEIVLKKGRELERGDQFLETLSDVIKRGIQNAEINLKKQVLDDEVGFCCLFSP
ncbi:UNVERIFIED_CONTAM: hypothetical protein HDU68_000470 [Siphonaria sp. JEL0065]|nr:hypothetical protein HDU68_000470 [Siphonaria sp. JEL0065]